MKLLRDESNAYPGVRVGVPRNWLLYGPSESLELRRSQRDEVQ